MVLENVTFLLHMHLKYCFKILLGKPSLKYYYVNCVFYINKILRWHHVLKL